MLKGTLLRALAQSAPFARRTLASTSTSRLPSDPSSSSSSRNFSSSYGAAAPTGGSPKVAPLDVSGGPSRITSAPTSSGKPEPKRSRFGLRRAVDSSYEHPGSSSSSSASAPVSSSTPEGHRHTSHRSSSPRHHSSSRTSSWNSERTPHRHDSRSAAPRNHLSDTTAEHQRPDERRYRPVFSIPRPTSSKVGRPPRPPEPDLSPQALDPRVRDQIRQSRRPQMPSDKVRAGSLSFLVTGTNAPSWSQEQRHLMFQDEVGEFKIAPNEVPPPLQFAREKKAPPVPGEENGDQEAELRKKENFERRAEKALRAYREGAHEEYAEMERKWEVESRQAKVPEVVWGEGKTWRDVDPSKMQKLDKVKFRMLPADFDTTISAANARNNEKVTVWHPLFFGMCVRAQQVAGGGAPSAPIPFPPPVRNGVMPDGRPGPAPKPMESRHMASRSADSRAGTGFAYPVPGTARVFVLAPKVKVSRLSVERRRCRNRFIMAWNHVVNNTEGEPPISHKRVYSFVLSPAIYEAKFKNICEMIEKTILEMHHKITNPAQRRSPLFKGNVRGHGRRGRE